eukprot:TRINITY_DN2251_c0_g1_i1.p4 TRINITY_DN2251_c0_g1~~TRINITY_DN2251_c0_g1_i1.p4  ORF type:complete len:130 (-),score=18.26 TRINITY_DN2251_c0_g1_i1:221-610(-)
MAGKQERDLALEVEKLSKQIVDTISEQQKEQQKTLSLLKRKLQWVETKLKAISQVKVGKGAAAGVGCGLGIGIGVQASGYINPFNLNSSAAFAYGIGFGAGCGVGIGYGYGLGVGQRIGKSSKINQQLI